MFWCIAAIFLLPFISAQNGSLSECPVPPYNNAISELIVNSLEAIRPCIVSGVPARGIPPLDPFAFPTDIVFNISNEYLVLDGYIQDTMIHNFAEFIMCEMTVELGLRQSLFGELRFDTFLVEGFYDMDGVITSIFPLFGTGNYSLTLTNVSMSIYANIRYEILSNTISVNSLELNVFKEDLVLFMECLLGCGWMADTINKVTSPLAEIIFANIWTALQPTLETVLENLLNELLSGFNPVHLGPDARYFIEEAVKDKLLNHLPIMNNAEFALCAAR